LRHLFLILLICFSRESFSLSKYLTESDLKQFYHLLDVVDFEKPKVANNMLLLVDKVEEGKATLVRGEYELLLTNDQKEWCRDIRITFTAQKDIDNVWSFSGSEHYNARVSYAPNDVPCFEKGYFSFGVNKPKTDKELSNLKTELERLLSQKSKQWDEKYAAELNYRLPDFAMTMPWKVVQIDFAEQNESTAIFQKYNVLAFVTLISKKKSSVIQSVRYGVK